MYGRVFYTIVFFSFNRIYQFHYNYYINHNVSCQLRSVKQSLLFSITPSLNKAIDNKYINIYISNMEEAKCYENYPYWIIIISNLLTLSIYTIGIIIIKPLGIIWLLIYLAYIVFLEIRLLRKSCVNCYYYGKRCAFGKGRLCSLFFKKGNIENFASADNMTWKDLIPDMLVSIIPAIIGIVRLFMDFNWILLLLVILLFSLVSKGNEFVRGSLACKYCKQREINCPADKMFNKGK